MRKVLTLLMLLFCITLAAKAQDLILKNDKTEIKAKILEITDDAIKYKKFEMLDGPTYSIKKSEVFMIVYANGTKEYIESIYVKTAEEEQKNTVEIQPQNNNTPYTTNNTNNYQSSISSNQGIIFGVQATAINATAAFDAYVNGSTSAGYSMSSIIGFRGGFFLSFPISNKISLIPSINYVSKGSKVSWSSTSSTNKYNYEETFKMNYIEVPLMLAFISSGNSGFMIGLGPVVSYGINGNANRTGTRTSLSTNTTTTLNPYDASVKFDGNGNATDNDEHFKALELSASALFGYRFSRKFALTLIYNKSFSNIAPEITGITYKYESSYLGLNLALGF